MVDAFSERLRACFATRYTHSSLEVCDLSDLVGLTRLLVKSIERIYRTFSLDRANDVE